MHQADGSGGTLPEGLTSAVERLYSRTLPILRAELDAEHSTLTEGEVWTDLTFQVRSIITRTLEDLSGPLENAPRLAFRGASSQVGAARARQNIHPSESLIAASALFDILLPLIAETDQRPPAWTAPVPLVARALHRSIMDAVVPASLHYVDALLDRLSVAHSEERLGISRDLHDRVAHGIAAALQRLSLMSLEDDQPELLASTRELLEDALQETRSIASNLRSLVGDLSFAQAVEGHIRGLDRTAVRMSVASRGIPFPTSTGVQEEAFIVVREMIGNALRHAHASSIAIDIEWSDEDLRIRVVDDGVGFARDDIRSGAMGLISATERAEVIGGELSVESTLGLGTSATLLLHRRRDFA